MMASPNPTLAHWTPPRRIDWVRHPSVVFESDDWGACEVARNVEDQRRLEQQEGHAVPASTLESPADLESLYQTLEQVRGGDGQPAVFTAFMCVGNPDYPGIEAGGFARYADIGVDQGFAEGWERGNVLAKWREGLRRGVFWPEFHSNLHHTSPVRLMERLREQSPLGDIARRRFAARIYYQGAHLPEFDGMNVKAQAAWIRTGIERFTRAFGALPAAAVTSDAYPVTETLWSANGIRIVSLKNSRINTGEVVVYHTKPWNNQDPYVPMGAFAPAQDLIYLIRNVYFESASSPEAQNAAMVLPVIRRCWERNEPAVISTHRSQYVSLNPASRAKGRTELASLLTELGKVPDIRFLATAEIGDLYRQGWCLRRLHPDGWLLRVWAPDAEPVRLNGPAGRAVCTADGRIHDGRRDGAQTVFELPEGEYLVHLDGNTNPTRKKDAS